MPTAAALYSFSVRKLMTVTPAVSNNSKVCQNQSAQITFNINNGTGGPYNVAFTGDATTGSANSVGNTLPIIVGLNTSVAGSFNYSLSQVSDANCTHPVTGSATLTVLPLPSATIEGDTGVCQDVKSPLVVFRGSNNPTAPAYKFDFNVNGKNPTSINSKTGIDSVALPAATDKEGVFNYTLTKVTDNNGCSSNVTGQVTKIEVFKVPLANFSIDPERTSILEPEIEIFDASISGQSYLWDFGDGSVSPEPNPISHTYGDTGTFTIKLAVVNGVCSDTTYQKVRVYLPTLLYIPQTFTPNGDDINEVFLPKGDGIVTFEMRIFDRWGNLIFFTDDINKGWDGKANGGSQVAQQDAYVYVIDIRALQDKHDYTYRGVVNLMR
jgi:gliding motility-associated-like protein